MRALLVLLLLATLAGCATKEDAPADEATGNDTADDDAMTTAPPEAITVTVGRAPGAGIPPTTYTLEPATLELVVGRTYDLTLVNADPIAGHDLQLEGLDVHIDTIPADSSSEPVQFTPTEAGTFRMYCTIGQGNPTGHDEMGMHGEVVVSASASA